MDGLRREIERLPDEWRDRAIERLWALEAEQQNEAPVLRDSVGV